MYRKLESNISVIFYCHRKLTYAHRETKNLTYAQVCANFYSFPFFLIYSIRMYWYMYKYIYSGSCTCTQLLILFFVQRKFTKFKKKKRKRKRIEKYGCVKLSQLFCAFPSLLFLQYSHKNNDDNTFFCSSGRVFFFFTVTAFLW